ncbi:MAG: monovalent cation/H(+) antiporter subunit G [Desulfurococcaceae archaeon]
MADLQLLLETLKYVGAVLLLLGGFFEITGAIGVLRMPSFFTRMHAVTTSAVGGTVIPLLGIFIVSLTKVELGWSRVYLALLCIASSILILIIAPAGTYALIKAASASKVGERKELASKVEEEPCS